MAALGKYKIPRPFQDEDKWFKYFTKKQLVYVGISLVIALRLIFWVKDYNGLIQIPVLTVGCILIICALLFGMLKMPDDRYLWGGGTTIEKLVVRLIRRRIRENRVIYVRNYHPEGESEYENGPGKMDAIKGKVGGMFDRAK